jgi:hypothetical protein
MRPLAILFGLVLVAITLNLSAQTAPAASVDLLWEAQTTAPEWYRGKDLASPGSLVRVVALVESSNSSLEYRWQKDGRSLGGVSGVGRNTLEFVAGQPGENHKVEVAVHGASGARLATKALTLAVAEPQLLFYEEDPAAGLNFFSALPREWGVSGPELTVVAAAFFFNANSPLEYRWLVNGEPVLTNVARPEAVTLLAPAAGVGDNLIELAANPAGQSNQTVRRELLLGGQRPSDFNF